MESKIHRAFFVWEVDFVDGFKRKDFAPFFLKKGGLLWLLHGELFFFIFHTLTGYR